MKATSDAWIRDPGTGLVMRKVYHDKQETQYAWDMAGRLHERKWARGVVNTWTHDPATGDLTGE
jgi:YD repeat-containing protein